MLYKYSTKRAEIVIIKLLIITKHWKQSKHYIYYDHIKICVPAPVCVECACTYVHLRKITRERVHRKAWNMSSVKHGLVSFPRYTNHRR